MEAKRTSVSPFGKLSFLNTNIFLKPFESSVMEPNSMHPDPDPKFPIRRFWIRIQGCDDQKLKIIIFF
jgi:hypothetical protein